MEIKNFKPSEWDRPERTRGGKLYPAAPYPVEWIEERWKPLALSLQMIRQRLGDHAIHVLSGYRDPAYNKAIGGAKLSQHMAGRAADIRVDGWSPLHVHDCILEMVKLGLLPNVKGLGIYPTFVHVDTRVATKLARWSGSRQEG